jgi:hypothetical protein
MGGETMIRSLRCPLILVLVGAALAWATIALADFSLRQKKYMKAQDEAFQKDVASANTKCGMKLKANIDWASFAGEVDKQLDGKLNYSFSGYCAEPVNTMFSMCDDADSKSAIAKKIKSYTCKFGGKGKRKIDLKGSGLTFWVDWEAANNGDFCKDFLGKKL